MKRWRLATQLLSCVSIFALGTVEAAAHEGDCLKLSAPTTINTNKRCVRVEKTVSGDVVNNATIGKGNAGEGEGDGNAERRDPGFFIGDRGVIGGKLVNNGTIVGGSSGVGALTLGEDADVVGGIFNNGTIASKRGSGISLGLAEYDDHRLETQAAALNGDIVNAGLISGKDYGVVARYGTMSGALNNQQNGVIRGGSVGVYIPDTFTSWTGGIKNSGAISGDFAGILIGNWGLPNAVYNDDGGEGGEGHQSTQTLSAPQGAGVVFSGGIFNYAGGTIVSEYGPSIGIAGASFSGGVYNNGLITQVLDGEEQYSASLYRGVGVVFAAPTVEGGLTNDTDGEIYGLAGPAVWITDMTQTFSGGIHNLGVISGATDGIRIESASFSDGLTNGVSGSIAGAYGDGVFATSAWTGGVLNDGLITGSRNGFTYDGTTFAGGFVNRGTITGGNTAVSMLGQSFDGGFANSGLIEGEYGDGVSITADTWGSVEARANIINEESGVIRGGATGFYLSAGSVYGDFLNDGSISGDGTDTGTHLSADLFDGNVTNHGEIESAHNALRLDFGTFDGAFSNSGTISGGDNGAILSLGSMTGSFTNSGLIEGESGNGVSIDVETWGSDEEIADILNTVDGVITGGETGFQFDGELVFGSFTNDGSISGGTNGAVFEVDEFNAPVKNTGTISGGTNGLVMELTDASGGFTNSGEITGESGTGVSITAETWGSIEARADIINEDSGVIHGGATGFYLSAGSVYGDFLNDGTISGDGEDTGFHLSADLFDGNVTNDGKIESAHNALRLDFGTFDGSFSNSGTISGGDNGAILSLGTMTGGFTNSGLIEGEYGNGVSITAETWGSVEARADIINEDSGVIHGGATGFYLSAGSVYGDFLNDGTISGDGEDTGVHLSADLFDGNVTNHGEIESAHNALRLDFGTFDGSFSNSGTISGGDNGAILSLGTMTGGFTNSGLIEGEYGDGVLITAETWGSAEARADIINEDSGVIHGGATGFYLSAGSVYGDFQNDGSISGDGTDTGTHLIADLFDGNVTNHGEIESAHNALRLDFGTFDGSFSNSGTISGGDNGAILSLGSMTGSFTNSGLIEGEAGNGVSIDVESWGSDEEIADILNTVDGVITGGDTGFQFDGDLVFGSFTNDGSISGGTNGAVFEVDEFNAPVKNTGTISGGTNGLVMELTDASGGFTNSGEITGESGTGVSITAETWGSIEARADIINEDSGVIHGGETGFYLSAGDVHGDFVNDGTITGGGEETGIHLIAGTFDGDVINNGLAQAASNALHLKFDTLTGVVRNTGTIEATDLPGTAVLLEIGNGAEFTNTGGGLIKGDVKFAGNAAYAFVAGEGGIEGSLLGAGGDDTISVRGAHYFVGGTANNFASFTVENGGLALMGARSEGGSSAGGYSFANVAALNVQNGGTLYLDKATVLEVGTYNQEAGSVAEFFLGAPSGISGLTGDVTAGQGDYGRILVSGSATLKGTIAGLLDPLFNSANAGLQSIRYNDVLVANGGINGDFSSVALIANSSLFQMNSVVDGNTIDVTVARTSLGDVSDVPGIIVNLGGPFDSMVSDRSNGVGSSSCGLAGEGWCLNRFAQNDATQVMTDASPVDPFDWLRTGMRNVGETAVWGRGIGSWGASDGWNGSKGSKFSLSGAIVGVDYVFERDLMAGVAAQWTTADVDFKGTTDNANVENFELGAYASFGDARLYLNTNASAIWHSIDVERFSNGGGHATASYSGTTLSAFAEAGKIFETEEGVRMGPFLSLSLTHLDTDPYLEAGTGPLLYVRGARLDSLKSTMGMRIAYPIALGSGRKFVPEARLGWSHEFMDDQASFRASVQGQNKAPSIILGEKFARDTAIVGGGVTVPLSDSTNLYADYDAGLNPDITTHTVSVGLRTSW